MPKQYVNVHYQLINLIVHSSVQRIAQRELQNPLATMILEGRFKPGDLIEVSADEDGLIISGEKLIRSQAADVFAKMPAAGNA